VKESLVPYSTELGYSRLFLDYVHDRGRLNDFYRQADATRVAALLKERDFDRDAIHALLMRQNTAWQAPRQVIEAIEKVKSDDSLMVFAGQQACLFGGPYLVILKALAAVKKAAELQAHLKVPIVPVFWIAADDHDFAEISFTDIFDASGEMVRLSLDQPDFDAVPPIGRMTYDASIKREIERLRELLPDNDFKDAALGPIENIYREGRAIVDCFAEYLLSLIGRFGIVLFNPHDEEFKAGCVGIMQEIVANHYEIKETLGSTESELTAQGYHLQVQKSIHATHLFMHTPARQPILHDGDFLPGDHPDGLCFQVGEEKFSDKQLIQEIAKRPFDFSPDVITRPLVQSFYFPTVAFFGGPAEIAYFAQLVPLFELFDLVPPLIEPRPSLTLLEARFEKLMDNYDLTFKDIAPDIEETIRTILEASFPDDLESRFGEFADRTKADMDSLGARLREFDAGLADMISRSAEKIDFQVKTLREKTFAAFKKKHTNEREKLIRLYTHVYPNRGMAERSIAPLYFVSRYGERIFDFMFENLKIGETGHRLLPLSDIHG